MKIIPASFKLDRLNYYKKHLSIVNCLIPSNLTVKEIEVLASFLSLDKVIIEKDVFNTEARKRVMESLNLKPGGLSNYLKSMTTKGVLNKDKETGNIVVKQFLLPEEGMQGFQIKLIDTSYENRK